MTTILIFYLYKPILTAGRPLWLSQTSHLPFCKKNPLLVSDQSCAAALFSSIFFILHPSDMSTILLLHFFLNTILYLPKICALISFPGVRALSRLGCHLQSWFPYETGCYSSWRNDVLWSVWVFFCGGGYIVARIINWAFTLKTRIRCLNRSSRLFFSSNVNCSESQTDLCSYLSQ